MPVYSYKGVNQAGKPAKGSLSAENARAARAQMRSAGIFLTEISESSGSNRNDSKKSGGGSLNIEFNLPQRIPPMERAMATRQLATLVSAGVPLVESLSALVEQTEHKGLSTVFAQIRDRVNEGSSLADALVSTGKFDNLYVSMVRAGEASGALDAVLDRVADYLEDQVRLNSRVVSILTYPLFMLLFAVVVVGVEWAAPPYHFHASGVRAIPVRPPRWCLRPKQHPGDRRRRGKLKR